MIPLLRIKSKLLIKAYKAPVNISYHFPLLHSALDTWVFFLFPQTIELIPASGPFYYFYFFFFYFFTFYFFTFYFFTFYFLLFTIYYFYFLL